MQDYALLSIKEPKTRIATARRQCAKLDIPDLLALVDMAFSKLHAAERLWNQSPQTLRARFKMLLRTIGLLDASKPGRKALDLGSLRPGGATWALQTTESGDLVMRRGRWASYRIMSIYIQEISAQTFGTSISGPLRTKILELAAAFPTLSNCLRFTEAGVSEKAWYYFFICPTKKDA